MSTENAALAGVERLRQFYTCATIISLAEIDQDGVYRNVNMTIFYGTNRTVARRTDPVTATARDSGTARRYYASVCVVDAVQADAFLEAARAGSATLPSDTTPISFDVGLDFWGFLPHGDFVEPTYPRLPTSAPSWLRRFLPRRRALGNIDLTERNIPEIVAQLPHFDDVTFEPLNLEHALDRLGVLDVLYPSHLRLWMRPVDGGLSYGVHDPLGWLSSFANWQLSVETRRDGMLVNARTASQSLSGMLPMDTPHAARYWFTADGLLLDAAGYTFVRTVGVNVGIMEPDIQVGVGSQTVSVPVAPRLNQQVNVGETQPVNDAITAAFLANSWRGQIARGEKYDERVFVSADSSNCRVSGIALLSEIIATTRDQNRIVRVVDPYGISTETMTALAPIVAGLPNGEIRLLSQNRSVDSTSTQEELDEDFVRVATGLARHLRIKIRWYKPTVGFGLHDRFLEIGDRVWHVGHSFNRFGCDLSAIVEFRNKQQMRILRLTLDQQFVDANLVREFP